MAIDRVLSVLACAAALAPHSALPQTAAKAREKQTAVVAAEEVDKRQFDRQLRSLPDAAVVESGGRRVTVGEIRARAVEAQKAVVAGAEADAKASAAKFAARGAQLAQQRQAKLDADGAKATTEVARLRGVDAIRAEAARLLQRSKTASPAQLMEIEARAKQLLEQLQKTRVAPVQLPR